MNKKGQALVEFIIVLPIFIMLLLAAFDWFRIIQKKSELESSLEDIVLNHNESGIAKEQKEDDKIIYTINDQVEIYSPVISVITTPSYEVEVSRTVYDE